MARIYLKYGTMGAFKSANLLATYHKYKEQGKNVILFKSAQDTRSKKGYIQSRIGLSEPCVDIDKNNNIHRIVTDYLLENNKPINAIIIDECQFLSKEHIFQLVKIAKEYDIPVLCYGLKNSYVKGELFEAISLLLYFSEDVEEIRSTCDCCGRKANFNLRVVNGIPIYEGELIKCGDTKKADEYYMSVCLDHYLNPILD